jgi:imidazole glycerol phosphate synthase glutamine amidotransferase subunit
MITQLGYRNRFIKNVDDFIDVTILLIPGVGAFASAMEVLHKLQLVEPIRQFAFNGNPVIGICLGMQLLADASYEHIYTKGLGLVPGEVKAINESAWHVGWNVIEITKVDPILQKSNGEHFYFNHSFAFNNSQYVIGVARIGQFIIPSIVRKDNIYGFQFHPEISQESGLKLMNSVIAQLNNTDYPATRCHA